MICQMKILKTQLILKRITNPKKLGTTLCSYKKKKKNKIHNSKYT